MDIFTTFTKPTLESPPPRMLPCARISAVMPPSILRALKAGCIRRMLNAVKVNAIFHAEWPHDKGKHDSLTMSH
jgi:hypothetical protein